MKLALLVLLFCFVGLSIQTSKKKSWRQQVFSKLLSGKKRGDNDAYVKFKLLSAKKNSNEKSRKQSTLIKKLSNNYYATTTTTPQTTTAASSTNGPSTTTTTSGTPATTKKTICFVEDDLPILNMPKVYSPSYRSSEEFGPYDAGYGAFSTNYVRPDQLESQLKDAFPTPDFKAKLFDILEKVPAQFRHVILNSVPLNVLGKNPIVTKDVFITLLKEAGNGVAGSTYGPTYSGPNNYAQVYSPQLARQPQASYTPRYSSPAPAAPFPIRPLPNYGSYSLPIANVYNRIPY